MTEQQNAYERGHVMDKSELVDAKAEAQRKNQHATRKLVVSFSVLVCLILSVLSAGVIYQGSVLSRRSPVLSHMNCRERLDDNRDKALAKLFDAVLPDDGKVDNVLVIKAKREYLNAQADLEEARDPKSDLYCDKLPT